MIEVAIVIFAYSVGVFITSYLIGRYGPSGFPVAVSLLWPLVLPLGVVVVGIEAAREIGERSKP